MKRTAWVLLHALILSLFLNALLVLALFRMNTEWQKELQAASTECEEQLDAVYDECADYAGGPK